MCHRRQRSQADDQELRQFTSHRPAVRRLSPGARPSRGGGRGCCRPRTSPASSSCRRTRCACWCPTASDRKSTRLNSSHSQISYAVFCLKKKKKKNNKKI